MQMELNQQYQETLDYLYSFIDFSLQKASRYSPERFELGRMRDFLSLLENPHEDYQIIHIAGTKGKGSVAAMCANALKHSGLKTGLYTSPHLQDYTERIQVNGFPIPEEELITLVDSTRPMIEQIPEITTFEITTALAFLYFSQVNVDVAVLEVGLGGRLDATNVCEPDVTVITSISYDHTYLLGDTLAKIAAEKAGILKPGIPLVLAPQVDEARQSILKVAAERSAPVFEIGKDFHYGPIAKSLAGQQLLVWSSADSEGDIPQVELSIPLLGEHQLVNATTAYATLMVARGEGISVSLDGIIEGFRSVYWPGRFEILRDNPPLIIDSAHNRDSAQKLYAVLQDYFPDRKAVLVFGASEDKDIRGMLSELKPAIKEIVMTRSSHPRAAEPDDLVALANELHCQAVATQSVEQAMKVAEKLAKRKTMILVTGSIFVAAAARSVWMAGESG